MELEELKDALKRRDALCSEILSLTESAQFTMSQVHIETESENFVELYNKREKLAAMLTAVHEVIGETGYAIAKKSADPDVAELLARSDESLRKIINLDRANKEIGAAFLNNTKSQIKRINQGRSISLKYNGELTDTDGYLIDNKN